MEYSANKEDVWRHRAFVVSALEKGLSTEVLVDESGYFVAKIDTRIGHDVAEDTLAMPRLMNILKARMAGSTSAN